MIIRELTYVITPLRFINVKGNQHLNYDSSDMPREAGNF